MYIRKPNWIGEWLIRIMCQYKEHLSRYGDSHAKDKSVVRALYGVDPCMSNKGIILQGWSCCACRVSNDVDWLVFSVLLWDTPNRLIRMVSPNISSQIITKMNMMYKLVALASLYIETRHPIFPWFYHLFCCSGDHNEISHLTPWSKNMVE